MVNRIIPSSSKHTNSQDGCLISKFRVIKGFHHLNIFLLLRRELPRDKMGTDGGLSERH